MFYQSSNITIKTKNVRSHPKSAPVVLRNFSPINTACLYTGSQSHLPILPALPFHRDSRISLSISLLLPHPQTDRSVCKLDWPQTQDFPAPGSSLRSQAWAGLLISLTKKGSTGSGGYAWGELILLSTNLLPHGTASYPLS